MPSTRGLIHIHPQLHRLGRGGGRGASRLQCQKQTPTVGGTTILYDAILTNCLLVPSE